MKKISNCLKLLFKDHNQYYDNKRKERLITLDVARGLAVMFMVFVHVQMTYSSLSLQYSTWGYLVDFLGSPPAAPVFIFTMGIFFILSSSSNDLGKGLKRGLTMLIISIAFSFFRNDIGLLLKTIGSHATFSLANLSAIWEVDILQFAGWALILMSLIKHVFKQPIIWLVLGLLILVISPLLWGLNTNIPFLTWLMNYFFGNNDSAYFPIFAWLFYPLMGMITGVFILASEKGEHVFSDMLYPGVFLLIAGSLITLTNFDFHAGDYFYGGPGSLIWILGFVFVWLWSIQHVLKHLADHKAISYLSYLGRETTSIYIIHWLLIAWCANLFGSEQHTLFPSIVMMVAFLWVSTLISLKIKIKL